MSTDQNSSNNRPQSSTRRSESGWEYWSRIYADPMLRSQIAERSQNAPTIREMLRNERLVSAHVTFTNIQRIGGASRKVIQSLIESECGNNIGIFDISFIDGQWRVRFYRSQDALKVYQTFDGYRFRNRILSVCYEETITRMDSNVGRHHIRPQSGTNAEREAVETNDSPIFKPKIWSRKESTQIEQFKNELLTLLKSAEEDNCQLKINDKRIISLNACSTLLIKTMLEEWPIGLFRICAPQIRFFGGYVSLGSNTQNSFPAGAETTFHPFRNLEEWEPFEPTQIRTDQHLLKYSYALLRRFGPQNTLVDLPWRILTTILSFYTDWPQDPEELMKLVNSISPQTLLLSNTLFLLTDEHHRLELERMCERLPE